MAHIIDPIAVSERWHNVVIIDGKVYTRIVTSMYSTATRRYYGLWFLRDEHGDMKADSDTRTCNHRHLSHEVAMRCALASCKHAGLGVRPIGEP